MKSTKWEYKLIDIFPDECYQQQLNWEGHADWELIQVLPAKPRVGFAGCETAVFKRPVSEEDAVGERD